MTKDTTSNPRRAVLFAATVAIAGGLGAAAAQTTAVEKPAQPVAVVQPANLLSFSQIESRLSTQGIKIKEVEVRDVLLEVEGYDANGREVELIVDRRNGDILSHRFDND